MSIRSSIHRLARAIGVALVLVLALTATAGAQGDPRVEARARYQAGMAKFNAGQYDDAIVEFRAADQIAPAPMNEYNIALAYDRKGDAASAVKAYRAFLDRSPNTPNRAEVEASIQRLAPAAAAAEAEAAAAAAARQAEAEAAAAAAAEAERRAAEEAATRPAGPAATGDPELDRAAAIDLAQIRGAQPLPAPSMAGGGGAGAAAGAPAAPGGEPAKATSSSRPFYKSPVFWVLAAVAVYAVIVLSEDDSDDEATPLTGRFLLPVDAPRSSTAPTVWRF